MSNPFASFNPNTTRWNANNALALACASQLAYSMYDNQPVVPATLATWTFDPARFAFLDNKYPGRNTQGFVAANDQLILVAFRGTQANNIWDWMTDADIVLRPFVAGMVHKGFYDGVDSVWDDVLAAIARFQKKGQSLWFTGHSLGAALACVAVARLIFEERKPVNGLYTFGQPRTGDYIFSSAFDHEFEDQTFRFVNDSDIVTRIAPRVLGYSHVGQTLFFDAGGTLQSDNHWWNQFLNAVTVGIEGLNQPAALVKEHAIALYITNMQKNLATPVDF